MSREARLGDDLLPPAPIHRLRTALDTIRDLAARPPAAELAMVERMNRIELLAAVALELGA